MPTIIEKIQTRLEECFQQAEEHYKTVIPRPKMIHWNTKGTTGGWSNYSKKEMMFNIVLAAENWQDYDENTIPHEAAHWVCDHVYGIQTRRTYTGKVQYIAHGSHWKSVMWSCYKINPHGERCHNYDVSNVKARVHRKWEYRCNCRVHVVKTNKHNKIQAGEKRKLIDPLYKGFVCNGCKSSLTFLGEKKDEAAEKQRRINQLLAQAEAFKNH